MIQGLMEGAGYEMEISLYAYTWKYILFFFYFFLLVQKKKKKLMPILQWSVFLKYDIEREVCL